MNKTCGGQRSFISLRLRSDSPQMEQLARGKCTPSLSDSCLTSLWWPAGTEQAARIELSKHMWPIWLTPQGPFVAGINLVCQKIWSYGMVMASVFISLNGIYDVYMYTDTKVYVCEGCSGVCWDGIAYCWMDVSSRHKPKCKMAFSQWGYPLGLYSPWERGPSMARCSPVWPWAGCSHFLWPPDSLAYHLRAVAGEMRWWLYRRQAQGLGCGKISPNISCCCL